MIALDRVRSLDYSSSMTTKLNVNCRHDSKTYWEFAAADLDDGHGDRSLINAFSNAKRALHFQVETLADAFGSKYADLGRDPSFPAILDFCSRCGIVTPRILRKLNRVRNALEHEYYVPNREETEDFVDVVQLFLAATDRYVESFPTKVDLESDDDDLHGVCRAYANLTLKPGTGVLEVNANELGGDERSLIQAARKAKDELEAEIKNHEESGVQVTMLDSVDTTAFRRAAQDKYTDASGTVSVTQGKAYFDWVAVFVEKAK